MALGWPVNEKGPEPGLPICPVNKERFNSETFLSTPITLWFNPMVHILMNPLASEIILAALRISSVVIPHFSAALRMESSKAICLHASKLEVCFCMNDLSIFFFSINHLAMALKRITSVPGKICKCRSAKAHVCVLRGSTTINLTLGFCSLCFSILRNKIGWHHAGLAPAIKKQSANSISA